MTARLFRLDSFNDATAPREPKPVEPVVDPQVAEQAAHDSGYAKGFTDGAARAAEAAQQRSENLQSGIIEALSDAQIAVQSARATAEGDLMQLVAAIADTALSKAAADDFSNRVCIAIQQELFLCPQACITLKLNPSEVELFAGQMPEGIAIQPDTQLATGVASICTDTGLTRLSTAEVLRRISQTLSIPSHQQEPEHEYRNRA
ncbi:hypothetical protein SAMN06273572_10490 [Monaibacterium marinum]|uniref:Flagellar assembly protein FliH n=1 Tax=Pontivivens marinum TaxID=1690039 RepID=A0A2C9CT07_9RHOB|nr:hypothetical protein [Monaibacterium marinum]SOH94392.1 hypothetical protein SAMN06273572_10490 [Monaibacterium marinum]